MRAMKRPTLDIDPYVARRHICAGRFAVAAAAVVLTAASPSRAFEVEASVSAERGNAASELLRAIVAWSGIPSDAIRTSPAGDVPYVFVRIGGPRYDADRATDAERVALAVLGATEAHAQLSLEGNGLSLIACTIPDPTLPVPPIANARTPDMPPGDGVSATFAIHLVPADVLPWIVAISKHLDPQFGQFIQDGIEVLKWNLGIDLRGDVAEQLEGVVRAAAGERDGRLAAVAFAPLGDRNAVERALTRIAFGSRFVAGTMPSLHATSAGHYEVKAPGFVGQAFVGTDPSGFLATVGESPLEEKAWREHSRALGDRVPRETARAVGARLALQVGSAALHARRLVRLLRLNTDIDGIVKVLRDAGGTASFELRVEDGKLVAWASWLP
jgi:hypothetical protein